MKKFLITFVLLLLSSCGGGTGPDQPDSGTPSGSAAVISFESTRFGELPAIIPTEKSGGLVEEQAEDSGNALYAIPAAEEDTGLNAGKKGTSADFPNDPPELHGSLDRDNAVVLSWTGYRRPEDFKIERSDSFNPGVWEEIAAIHGKADSYRDPAVAKCTTYQYRIRWAKIPEGNSPYSNIVAVEVPETDIVPELPFMSGSGDYVLSWTTPGGLYRPWIIQESTDPAFTVSSYLSSMSDVPPYRYSFTGKANGTWCYRVGWSDGPRSCLSRPACITVSSETSSATIFAALNNTLRYSSSDDSANPAIRTNDRNTVFREGLVSVGCNWLFDANQGVQNFICSSAALKFDFGPFAGRTITRAVLRLYPYYLPGDRNTLYEVYAFSEDWDPSALTYASRPAFFRSGAAEVYPPFSTSVPLEFDVTRIVQRWADGTWANNGFLVQDATFIFPYATLFFTTHFESTQTYSALSRRPQLFLEYR